MPIPPEPLHLAVYTGADHPLYPWFLCQRLAPNPHLRRGGFTPPSLRPVDLQPGHLRNTRNSTPLSTLNLCLFLWVPHPSPLRVRFLSWYSHPASAPAFSCSY